MTRRGRGTRARTRAIVVGVLLGALGATGMAWADDQRLYEVARKSFAKVTVRAAPIPKDRPAWGSAVLISPDGHLLTAAHVVKLAVTEGSSEESVEFDEGASVTVQFVRSDETLEDTIYDAEVLYYSASTDIALLKINLQAYVPDRLIPVLDVAGATTRCASCFLASGYTEKEKFEQVPAGSRAAIDKDYKRELLSGLAPGYSGGSVLLNDLRAAEAGRGDGVSLVGIAAGGEWERQAANFMVTLYAADRAFRAIRHQLRFREPIQFPSRRLLKVLDVATLPREDGELKRLVVAKVASRERDGLITVLLGEDFQTAIGAGGGHTNSALRLLEYTLDALYADKQFIDVVQYRYLVSRLGTMYALLEQKPGPEVNYRRMQLLVYRRACDARRNVERFKCWRGLDGDYKSLVTDLEREYSEIVKAAMRGHTNAQAPYWLTTYIEHLFEWADMLAGIAKGNSGVDLKASLLQHLAPRFLDEGRGTLRQSLKDAGVIFLAAAEDKYERARGIVDFARQNDEIRRIWLPWRDYQRKMCAGLERLNKDVRELLDHQDPYVAFLDARMVNEVRPSCQGAVPTPVTTASTRQEFEFVAVAAPGTESAERAKFCLPSGFAIERVETKEKAKVGSDVRIQVAEIHADELNCVTVRAVVKGEAGPLPPMPMQLKLKTEFGGLLHLGVSVVGGRIR